MASKRRSLTSQLHARGFDRSRAVPFERGATVRCSQCEAACINGVPCHETGCPNDVTAQEAEDAYEHLAEQLEDEARVVSNFTKGDYSEL